MNDPKSSGRANANANPTTEKRTLVEDGTNFKGSLTSTCPIYVQGGIEGNVSGPALTVSQSGTVTGKVETTMLKSAGKISGEFDVDTAQISGEVSSKTVLRANSLDVQLSSDDKKIELTFSLAPGGKGGSFS